MANYQGFQSLGKITVTANSPVKLTVNCGSQQETPAAPQGAIPTRVFRQILLGTPSANGADVYLIPQNTTAAANPGTIYINIPAGQTRAFPEGFPASCGFILDNFLVDCGTGTCTVYGTAFE